MLQHALEIFVGIFLFPLCALPGILLALRWLRTKASAFRLFAAVCVVQVATGLLWLSALLFWPASALLAPDSLLYIVLELALQLGALALAVRLGAHTTTYRSIAAGTAGYFRLRSL